MTFTIEEKRDAARHEAESRKRIYRKWIETGGTFSADTARRIMILEEIAGDYSQLAENERLTFLGEGFTGLAGMIRRDGAP